MTIAEKLERAAHKLTHFLTSATDYDFPAAELRDLVDDAAKHIRHFELINAEAIKALGEHTGADLLVVPK